MNATSTKRKVICYIDGFNFYHGLRSKNWKKFYWIDAVKLIESFLKPHQELIELNYFSAVPKDNKAKQDRQDLFFSANRQNPKFILHLGKYFEKNIKCFNCGNIIKSYEEKQTDVCVAVKMIRNVILDKCDISILISADSDLVPPIDFIREQKPWHKIFVYFPPSRFSFDLKAKADNSLLLEHHVNKFQNAIMPDNITLPSGYIIKKPIKWS